MGASTPNYPGFIRGNLVCFLYYYGIREQKNHFYSGDAMASGKASSERNIKKLLIKVHRDVFGKGPEEVWVSVTRNVATFYCSNSLTALEEFLLTTPGGEDEVKHLRHKITKYISPTLYSELEKTCGITVLSMTMELCTRSRVLFGAILFQEPFGDKV